MTSNYPERIRLKRSSYAFRSVMRDGTGYLTKHEKLALLCVLAWEMDWEPAEDGSNQFEDGQVGTYLSIHDFAAYMECDRKTARVAVDGLLTKRVVECKEPPEDSEDTVGMYRFIDLHWVPTYLGKDGVELWDWTWLKKHNRHTKYQKWLDQQPAILQMTFRVGEISSRVGENSPRVGEISSKEESIEGSTQDTSNINLIDEFEVEILGVDEELPNASRLSSLSGSIPRPEEVSGVTWVSDGEPVSSEQFNPEPITIDATIQNVDTLTLSYTAADEALADYWNWSDELEDKLKDQLGSTIGGTIMSNWMADDRQPALLDLIQRHTP